jgi:hypothetical protein
MEGRQSSDPEVNNSKTFGRPTSLALPLLDNRANWGGHRQGQAEVSSEYSRPEGKPHLGYYCP